jgi:hypothetical protein
MAAGVPEPDVELAYHATYENCVESIMARGLLDLDTGGRRAEDPDEPEAVYLWGEEGEAACFCEEWGRDTIVIVNVFDLDGEPDPDVREGAFGGAYEDQPTDYCSAFRVRGSIGPERILDVHPSSWSTPYPAGFNRNGKPRRYYGDDGE